MPVPHHIPLSDILGVPAPLIAAIALTAMILIAVLGPKEEIAGVSDLAHADPEEDDSALWTFP